MHYWLEVPGMWYCKRRWYKYEDLPKNYESFSSNRSIRTAKKAFRALNNSPKGSVLIRFIKHVPGKGWLTQEWERI